MTTITWNMISCVKVEFVWRIQTCLLFRIGRKPSAFQGQLPTSRIFTKSSAFNKNPQNIVFLCLIRFPNTLLIDRVDRVADCNSTRTHKPPITSKQTRGPSRKLIKYVGRLWGQVEAGSRVPVCIHKADISQRDCSSEKPAPRLRNPRSPNKQYQKCDVWSVKTTTTTCC